MGSKSLEEGKQFRMVFFFFFFLFIKLMNDHGNFKVKMLALLVL